MSSLCTKYIYTDSEFLKYETNAMESFLVQFVYVMGIVLDHEADRY